MQPADPLEAGLLLAQAFEAHGVSYALGGALAYGIWGIPRASSVPRTWSISNACSRYRANSWTPHMCA
jgi:hypothetical protein